MTAFGQILHFYRVYYLPLLFYRVYNLLTAYRQTAYLVDNRKKKSGTNYRFEIRQSKIYYAGLLGRWDK